MVVNMEDFEKRGWAIKKKDIIKKNVIGKGEFGGMVLTLFWYAVKCTVIRFAITFLSMLDSFKNICNSVLLITIFLCLGVFFGGGGGGGEFFCHHFIFQRHVIALSVQQIISYQKL